MNGNIELGKIFYFYNSDIDKIYTFKYTNIIIIIYTNISPVPIFELYKIKTKE